MNVDQIDALVEERAVLGDEWEDGSVASGRWAVVGACLPSLVSVQCGQVLLICFSLLSSLLSASLSRRSERAEAVEIWKRTAVMV